MADYRDPKVTTTTGAKRDSGKWIGIAVAVLVLLLLIAWWAGAFNGAGDVAPEATAPTTEAPAAGAPATTDQPAAPAQQ
jgi:hypothetical protein